MKKYFKKFWDWLFPSKRSGKPYSPPHNRSARRREYNKLRKEYLSSVPSSLVTVRKERKKTASNMAHLVMDMKRGGNKDES